MNRNKLMIMLAPVLAAAMLLPAGCEDDEESTTTTTPTATVSPLAATWSLSGASLSGTPLSTAQIAQLFGATGGTVSVTMNNDNTLTTTSMITSGGPATTETATGTWSSAGDQLTITIEGESVTVTYNISGNDLTLSAGGLTIQGLLTDLIDDLDPLTAVVVTSYFSGTTVSLIFTK